MAEFGSRIQVLLGLDLTPAGQIVALCAVLCCLAAWVAASNRVRAGRELLPWTTRRPVTWGLLDVIIGFILFLIFEIAALQMLGLPIDVATGKVDLEPSQQAKVLVLMALGRLAAMLMSVLVLVVRTHARSDDTGLGWRHATADIRLGATAFVMIAPPIYYLQNVLTNVFWPNAAHPLVDVIRDSPTLPLFGAAFFTAVVSAPIVEEYMLRGLFQGWLEKMAVWRGNPMFVLTGGTVEWEPKGDTWTDGAQVRQTSETPHPPLWPVFASSLLFGMMHIQPNQPSADPIALFFFALGLGYLYQRTHRLLPCIVMHMLLNTSSMIILAFSVGMSG